MNITGTDADEFERAIDNAKEWNGNMMEGTIYKRAAHRALKSPIYCTSHIASLLLNSHPPNVPASTSISIEISYHEWE